MSKIITITLSLIFCFTACKTEDIKQEISNDKIVRHTAKYCYLNGINQKDNKFFAVIDFIEYKKISEIDSVISPAKVIELPNGFFYVNKEQVFENFELSLKTGIIMRTFSFNDDGNFNYNQVVPLDELYKFFSDTKQTRFKIIPFKVVFNESLIDSLIEIYIP